MNLKKILWIRLLVVASVVSVVAFAVTSAADVGLFLLFLLLLHCCVPRATLTAKPRRTRIGFSIHRATSSLRSSLARPSHRWCRLRPALAKRSTTVATLVALPTLCSTVRLAIAVSIVCHTIPIPSALQCRATRAATIVLGYLNPAQHQAQHRVRLRRHRLRHHQHRRHRRRRQTHVHGPKAVATATPTLV